MNNVNCSLEHPKTIGIIAEFNPFHNGHAHLISEAKRLSGAQYCVVVMSGDFVQRGAPAIVDKYTRTRMALACGVDLVLEMPPIFALSSAEDFAGCGVAILDKLGVVDELWFGSESGDIDLLQKAASVLAAEPEEFTNCLQNCLREGKSFPAARAEALHSCLSDLDEETLNSLTLPNNTLGIEYCKALLKRRSSITPKTISRLGKGYHEITADGEYASATGIRKLLLENNETDLSAFVPGAALSEFHSCHFVDIDDFSPLLQYRLLQAAAQKEDLTNYLDFSQEIRDRLLKQSLDFKPVSEMILDLKTRQYTHTRISRCLMHLLLDMKKEDFLERKSSDYTSYVRVLGFRKESSLLMHAIKKKEHIRLITKVASEKEDPSFSKDIIVSHIYSTVLMNNNSELTNEFLHSPIVI